jgi:micrococcal nuclease
MRFALKVFIGFVIFLLMVGTLEARQIRVAWVPDGDTLILENREVIRLKGIDAPETGFDGESDQYFARKAAQRLEELISGKKLTFRPGQQLQDRHGRSLGYVYLPDNKNVSILMVRDGFAFYYPHQDQNREIASRILRSQKKAIDQNLGFWPEILNMEEADLTYVGNTRSKRFHVLECGYGQRISDSNRIEFSSLHDAFYKGYAPCRRCTPWPSADR